LDKGGKQLRNKFGDNHPTHCRHGLDKDKYFCKDDGTHLKFVDKEGEKKLEVFVADLTQALNNIFNKG